MFKHYGKSSQLMQKINHEIEKKSHVGVSQLLHNFIKLKIRIDGSNLSLVVPIIMTIDELSRKIEIELAMKNSDDKCTKLIQIAQLYIFDFIPLNFENTVQTCINADETIVGFNGIPESKITNFIEEMLTEVIPTQFFLEFCLNDYCAENVLFYLDIYNFRSIDDAETRKVCAELMFNKYLNDNAPLKLNLPSLLIADISTSLSSNVEHTFFDKIYCCILQILKKHTYPRYLKSQYYKECNTIIKEKEYKIVLIKQKVWTIQSIKLMLQQMESKILREDILSDTISDYLHVRSHLISLYFNELVRECWVVSRGKEQITMRNVILGKKLEFPILNEKSDIEIHPLPKIVIGNIQNDKQVEGGDRFNIKNPSDKALSISIDSCTKLLRLQPNDASYEVSNSGLSNEEPGNFVQFQIEGYKRSQLQLNLDSFTSESSNDEPVMIHNRRQSLAITNAEFRKEIQV
jgi:hypothetical protein